MAIIPDAYQPLFRTSPFLDLIGPIYSQKNNEQLIIAVLAEEKHCNARGSVHGGVLSSLADVALGYNAAFSGEKPVPMVTVSLSIDYVGQAKLGDLIEIKTDVQKVGRSMAFASCYFYVDELLVAKASGVFKVIQK